MRSEFLKHTLAAIAACALLSVCSYGQSGPVVYVSKTGNDANNGTSWNAAKLTVAAAVSSLPVQGTLGSGGNNYGTVYLGPGIFVENATPIQWNQAIRIVGTAANDFDGQGTVIELGNNRNTDLFSYTPDYSYSAGNYGHYLSMEHVVLNGNAANNTNNNSALIRTYNGGYNTYLRDVTIEHSAGHGIYIERTAINFACYSCSFDNNAGDAVYFDDTAGGMISTFIDTQIDSSGADPIQIHQQNSDITNGSNYTFVNLKTESAAVPGAHVHVIDFYPRTQAYGNSVAISVIGGRGDNTSGVGASYAYEEPGAGIGARWLLQNITPGVGYPYCFSSGKTSTHSQGSGCANFSAGDTSTNAAYGHLPEFEGPRGTGIIYGQWSTPNGNVTANPGSEYINLNGGAGQTLWVKESGTGTNTGWAAK